MTDTAHTLQGPHVVDTTRTVIIEDGSRSMTCVLREPMDLHAIRRLFACHGRRRSDCDRHPYCAMVAGTAVLRFEPQPETERGMVV